MSGADPARFWQPTQHPRVLVCSAVRSKALLTDRRRSRSVELKFHGKLMGSEQGFCSQADWGPARLSGTDGAPFATGHRVCEWGGKGPLLTPLQHPPPGPGMPRSWFWETVTEVPLRDCEGTFGPPARAPGMGGPPYTHPIAMLPGGWRDHASPGSVRQCANLTFGFMTLFLCSKCHGKCQAEAEAGKGPVKEAGGVPRGSGQGRLRDPHLLPGAPMDCPSCAWVQDRVLGLSQPATVTLLRCCLYLPASRAQMGQAQGPASSLPSKSGQPLGQPVPCWLPV